MVSEIVTNAPQADASRLARLLHDSLLAGEALPAALDAVARAVGASGAPMRGLGGPGGEVGASLPSAPAALLQAGFDAMPDGVALLDREGRLVFANAALHAMVALADGLTLGPRGLDSPDPAVGLALRRAAMAALAAAEGRLGLLPSAGSLAIHAPSGVARWMVRALPMGPRGQHGPRGAMLLVRDAMARAQPAPALLARLFRLTPAEASLAASLAAGRSLDDHARRRGIARETVRSQLAAIRRKTGCRRQADLVALLARIPG
jgi:DNA-binding CsgD family transcriptional regulator